MPALFVFLTVFLFQTSVRVESRTGLKYNAVSPGPDTNKVKYDINDPRNPDCPCHAAQKLADDEYRRSQRGNNDNNPVNQNNVVNNDNSNDKNNNSNKTDVNTNKTTFTSSSGGSQKHYSKYYKFQKKMKRWSKKMKRKLGSKNKGTKGGKFRVADCFHFY